MTRELKSSVVAAVKANYIINGGSFRTNSGRESAIEETVIEIMGSDDRRNVQTPRSLGHVALVEDDR